jgi:hypothetical protein
MSMAGIIVGIGIILGIKFLVKNMLLDHLAGALSGGQGGNPIIGAVIHFLVPGLFAIGMLFMASYVAPICPQLAGFLVVITVVIGGILGLGIAYFATSLPFIGTILAPSIAPIIPFFWALLIIAIVEFILGIVLPIVLPGAGLILSTAITLGLSVATIFVLGGFAGGDLFNVLTCVKQASGNGFLIDIQKKIFGGAWIGTAIPKAP